MKSRDEITTYLTSQIEEIKLGTVAADQIAGDQRLIQDLGLDSLDYATCLLACEKWLGIKVREDGVDWGAIQTVDQLAQFLEQQQHPN